MKKNISYLILVLLLFGIGCTRNIKVSMNLPIQNPSSQKIAQRVLVVMSKEQAESVIIEKPGPMSDYFRFEAGKAISSNILSAMQALYEQVEFSNQIPQNDTAFDAYLLVDYKKYHIRWGSTAFSQVNMNIYIDYELLDKKKQRALMVSTDGSSSWRRKGGEAVALINPFISIMLTNSSLGEAWDQALSNSIFNWVYELQNHYQKK